MNFDIKTEQLGDDAYVISLAGEVDLYTAPEFKQQLLDVIAQGAKNVVVDFTDTTFIDSTTLGVLVGGVKRLRTNDGQLSLVCSDRNITKIFEITGLDRVFTIHATRDEAVGRARSRRSPPRSLAPAASPSWPPLVLALAGCGAGGPADESEAAAAERAGKQLFIQKCGGCHTLEGRPERAGRSGRTSTTRSPPHERGLRRGDDPRGRPRADRFPIAPMPEPDSPQMFPSKDYTDAEREASQTAIAMYVAQVAGNRAGDRPGAAARWRYVRVGPKGLFTQNCGGCHTLAAAGTSGQVGPNLDQAHRHSPASRSRSTRVAAGCRRSRVSSPSSRSTRSRSTSSRIASPASGLLRARHRGPPRRA